MTLSGIKNLSVDEMKSNGKGQWVFSRNQMIVTPMISQFAMKAETMSEAMYNKMRERWYDFLNAKRYLGEPRDRENLMDMYDDLADEFCEECEYSDKTKEFAFHGQWFDTFADDYFKILEKGGWEGFAVRDEVSMEEKQMWVIVLVVAILTIIAAIFISDYINYEDLQRRLREEKENKLR